jgi:hypothetical protein
MKLIALIGEDPNDTKSIQNLLSQKYSRDVKFYPIIRNKRGDQLNNTATIRALEIELQHRKYHFVIFIRDLDGLETEKSKFENRRKWFDKLNKVCNNKGLLLLNIYELEALILADIEIFNKEYKVSIANVGNVMSKKQPKEFLILKTNKLKKKYAESDCPDLFKKLRFPQVTANCKYFRDFVHALDRILKKK